MARKDTIANALLRAGEELAYGNRREADAVMRDIESATDSEWDSEFGRPSGGDNWWMSCVE